MPTSFCLSSAAGNSFRRHSQLASIQQPDQWGAERWAMMGAAGATPAGSAFDGAAAPLKRLKAEEKQAML